MIYSIFIIIFLVLAGGFVLGAFYIFYKNYKNIISGDVVVDEDYNAIKIFFDTIDSVLKFIIKKSIRTYRFSLHYLVLVLLKGLDIIQDLIELLYQKVRSSFVSKSVQNKAFVVHFWGHLKHYKREMDSEQKELENK